jgi:hypothetical protein
VPDAPISLLRDNVQTNTSQVAFNWTDGSSNGGAPIIDYLVSYNQGNGNWIIL